MANIKYEDWTPGVPGSKPRAGAQVDIDRAIEIGRDYARQGYDLTLRQMYYQFVSRGWLENTERSYKNLGSTLTRARMAGLFDWDWMVDRTRSLYGINPTADPGEAISDTVWRYHLARWADQEHVIEVWVEKEALAGVVGRVCTRWDVDYFPSKGYASISAAQDAGKRIGRYVRLGKQVTILYLGDHDPSGIDMTRDVEDRLTTFLGRWSDGLTVKRIALNRDQVDEYNPPPNPAKLTDPRGSGYVDLYGDESWELDALDPATLDALIDGEILELVDLPAFEAVAAREETDKDLLRLASSRWDELVTFLQGDGDDDN